MVSEQAKKEFGERLGKLSSIGNVALGRIYDSSGKLLTIVPNLTGKSGSLKVFNEVNDNGIINPHAALEIFGSEYCAEATGDAHPNIQLVQRSLKEGKELKLELVKTKENNLLESLINGTATPEQKLEGLNLLQRGLIRTAEKTYGVNGDKSLWEPQNYSISALNSGFGLFGMGTYPENPQYVDKIPLWTQKVTHITKESLLNSLTKEQKKLLEKINEENLANEIEVLSELGGYGVNSPFMTEEELIKTGVRLIPGSFARIGAYIGAGTTIMPGGVVNIGAYIAGENVMVDGGARVASGAQVGKGVKIGAGTGLEGVLEPAGMMPTIVEDGVRIGANCEVTGIIGERALIASGVVMATGKKIYDLRTGKQVEPLYVNTVDGVKSVPHIPANRVAVGGSSPADKYGFTKDAILLLEKDADKVNFMHVPKNATLYAR